MLDLKVRYEPMQETPHLRPASTSDNSRKSAGRSDSFNRIFKKARQSGQDQRQVNTGSDKRADVSKPENNSMHPTRLDKPAKTEASSPANTDNPNRVDQPEPDQSAEKSRQATMEQDPGSTAEIVTNMSEVVLAAAEYLDQSNSVGLEASISGVTSKNPADIQMEVMLDETESLTGVRAQQTMDAASQILANPGSAQEVLIASTMRKLDGADEMEISKLSVTANNLGGVETNPLLNQVKASGQDLTIAQSAQPIDTRLASAQQVESQTAPMQPEQNETSLATTDKTDMEALIKNQTNASAVPILADGRAASNTANGVLALVAQALENAEPTNLTGNKPDEQDLANQGSSAPSGVEEAKSERSSKSLSQEDIRFKLIEKNLMNSKNSDEKQPGTDIKKLLVSENQRLSVAKAAAEGAAPTETPVHNQAETLPTATGLEKNSYTPARTGLDTQTIGSQSTAANVDPEDLIEQIVKKVEILNKASNSEMKIQLKPEFMGKMIIKIAVEDGIVTAKFITESQHVKQLLEANLGSLKQNLESQGLKVDRTEVNVQLDNGGSFHGNDGGRQQLWQEYADRNATNRFNYQTAEDYQQNHEATLDSYTESTADSAVNTLVDGSVDFMI